MRKLYRLLLLLLLVQAINIASAQCPVTIVALDTICPNGTMVLIARVTGGTPTTFAWSSTAGGSFVNNDTVIVAPSVTTTYTILVSGNGCNSTDNHTVTTRPAPATPNMNFTPDNVCAGTVLSFSTTPVGGVTYRWNFGDGTFATGANTTHRYTLYGGGSSAVTATITATGTNGCTTSFQRTVTVVQKPHAVLHEGSGVDTTTFNGVITFYKCYTNGQTSTVFNFQNNMVPTINVTSTIIWGDTGVNFTSTTNWANISHVYSIGIFNLTYIVTNNITGCSDTTRYRVFFGSNAAGGIATLGSTNICGPSSLLFILTNFQTNPPGTLYKITFNDSTAPLTFVHPPPDTITHYFQESSCGTYSSNGIVTYNNSFAAYLSVSNPCGVTSGSVLPIYVSLSPVAQFTVTGNDTVCQGTNAVITNRSVSGEIASNNSCNRSTIILWNITPSTGWTLNSGSFGNDNGFIGGNYDPNSWTSGSQNLNVTFNTLGNYQVRLIAANNCGVPDTTYRTVCVGTPPSPTFTLPTNIGCAPYTLTPNNTTATPNGCSVVNYTWTATLNSFLCPSDSLNNIGYVGGTSYQSKTPNIRFYNQGVYDLTMTAQNSCGTFTTPPQTVTVKDKPEVTLPAIPGVCSGQSISPTGTGLSCAGTISGYSWTFQGGTPPTASVQTPGNISFSTPGAHLVSFGVTNECGTNTLTTTVSVDTIPLAEAGPDKQICSNGNIQIGVPGDTSLFRYAWTPSTGLSDTSIPEPFITQTNNGSTAIVAKYYLTVSKGGGCGATDSVTVTIAPGVTVNAGPPTNVCAGRSIVLQGSFGGATTSVAWTSDNGGIFSDTADATATYTPAIASGTVNLTLTSNQPSGTCPPATSTTTLTVIPPPVADAGAGDSVCGGDTIQIGVPNQFGYTYTWSPALGLSNTGVSNPRFTFVNTGTTITNQVYMLVVSAVGCSDTANVTLAVYPTPVVTITSPGNTCAGSDVPLTGAISGGATSCTWSSAEGTFNPTTGTSTQFTPTIPVGIAYITLTTDDPAGPCIAKSFIVTDTIKPLATITNNPLTQTICSEAATLNIVLASSLPGSTYSWVATSPDGVTGFIASDTTSEIAPQTLVNANDTAGTVIITITPIADGCVGVPSDYIIRVNPLPQVILPAVQTICDNTAFTTVNLASNVAGTTYSWTSAAGSTITGNTASGTGDITTQVLHNVGTDTSSVVYHVIPSANTCTGISANYVVIVNPSPTVLFAPAPQTICSGQTSQQVALTSPTPGVTITWSAVLPAGLISSDTTGTFTIPAQLLTDTFENPLTIQYTAQAATTGTVCPGTLANYSITVQPIPEVAFNLSPANGCTPLFVTVVPVIRKFNVPDSLIFDWGDGSSNSVLYPNQNTPIWNSLPHSFYNNTAQPVTYNIGMRAHNLCIDTTVLHPVNLLPNLISAFFTPSVTTGCEPLTVTFTDQSTGANSISWCFDYDATTGGCPGGGVIDTPGSVVTRTFTGGAHNVILYITNGFGCARDTAMQVIYASPAPDAAFDWSADRCAGAPITFIQQSSSTGGSFLTAYNWQFGDGDSSTVSAPVHVYDTTGTYPVCLDVTSSFGCVDTACRNLLILDKPQVGFTYADTCVNTQPIVFTNTTIGANFYAWNFADGNSSANTDPTHTYAGPGTYKVVLIASNNSCTDSVMQPVVVYPTPNVSFTIPADFSCGVPSLIPVTNTSTGAVGYNWDFGNNTYSANTSPAATYTVPNTYTISLAASNQYRCYDTARTTINIYPFPVIQSIDVQPANGCQPLDVVFTANATNANTYVWDFGDGQTFTSATNGAQHSYIDTGVYSVLLTVYSSNICGDTVLLQDTIQVHIVPTANFSFTVGENIDPVNGTVEFTNLSQNSTTYLWHFGDGSTSTDKDPSHLFLDIDSFNVLLYAISDYGCVDSTLETINAIKKTLYVPNAFAPDFDGPNELVKVWKPVASGLKNYHAQVFNKWGELMWESTTLDAELSPSEGWNGSYQGKVCLQDVYVWKIEATFLDGTRWAGMSFEKGKPRKTIGSVTLIR